MSAVIEIELIEYCLVHTHARTHTHHTHTHTPANSPESEPSTPRSNVESLDNDTTQNEVELQLRPHPNHPVVSDHAIRNLVTSPLCTISHLVKFLSINQLLEKDVQKHKGQSM